MVSGSALGPDYAEFHHGFAGYIPLNGKNGIYLATINTAKIDPEIFVKMVMSKKCTILNEILLHPKQGGIRHNLYLGVCTDITILCWNSSLSFV